MEQTGGPLDRFDPGLAFHFWKGLAALTLMISRPMPFPVECSLRIVNGARINPFIAGVLRVFVVFKPCGQEQKKHSIWGITAAGANIQGDFKGTLRIISGATIEGLTLLTREGFQLNSQPAGSLQVQ